MKDINLTGNPFEDIKILEQYYLDIEDSRKVFISNELGIAYRDIGNYEKSIEYFNLGINHAKEFHASEEEIGVCIINLASSYRLNKDLENSRKCLDEARNYIKKENVFFYASLLNYYGHYYLDLNEFEKANEYYMDSVDLIENIEDNNIFLINGYSNIANSLIKMENYDLALEYYLKVKDIYEIKLKSQDPYYIRFMIRYISLLFIKNDFNAKNELNNLQKIVENNKIQIPEYIINEMKELEGKIYDQ